MNFSHFFIRRPIFAGVLSIVIFLVGPDLAVAAAGQRIPGSRAADRRRARDVSRREPEDHRRNRGAPLEQAINGVENSLYMFSQATSDGVMTLTVTFKLGTDVDNAQVQVQNRVSQALPKLPEEVRRLGVTTTKQSPDLTMVVHLFSPERPLRRNLSAQLRHAAGEGRARAHSRRRCSAGVRLGRLRDARLARTPTKSPRGT